MFYTLHLLTFTYVYLHVYIYLHVLACTDTISMRMINSRGQAQQVTAGGVPFWHPTSFSKATLHGRHLSVVVNYIDQVECPPGSWCADGVKQPCPLGTYGVSSGLSNSRCSGPCHAGYYCPQGSISPVPCAPGHWCDGNSSVSCPAGRYGSTSLLGSDTCTGPCSPGHYCLAGSTSPTQNICPPGRFGSRPALGSPECSGQCDAGYYCPDDGRSMNATRYPCGGSHVYCPHGSGAPIPVSPGFYSVGGGSDST